MNAMDVLSVRVGDRFHLRSDPLVRASVVRRSEDQVTLGGPSLGDPQAYPISALHEEWRWENPPCPSAGCELRGEINDSYSTGAGGVVAYRCAAGHPRIESVLPGVPLPRRP